MPGSFPKGISSATSQALAPCSMLPQNDRAEAVPSIAASSQCPPVIRAQGRAESVLGPIATPLGSCRRLGLGAAICLTLGAGALLFFFNPSDYAFYPRCFFHNVTGLLCPGCGSLRALHQLLHGRILAAARCNALLILALLPAGWVAARAAWCQLRRQPVPRLITATWLWLALAAGLLFGLLRNTPFGHSWLAP